MKFENGVDIIQLLDSIDGTIQFLSGKYEHRHRSDIDVLISTIREYQKNECFKQTWYPMADAPRDGTEIIVCNLLDDVYLDEGDDPEEYVIAYYGECESGFSDEENQKGWLIPYSEQDECGGCSEADNPIAWTHVPRCPQAIIDQFLAMGDTNETE